MFSWLKNRFKKSVPLDLQLVKLAEHGIRLRPGVTRADLTREFEAGFYEEDPYRRLLPVLGENQRVAGGRFSDDILLLDTECIEGNGSYVRVLEPMVAMTHGALPLADLKDSVEGEPDQAWVQFRLRGRTQRWNVTVDADWIDPTILGRMGGLLAQQNTPLAYVYDNPGGQTALIACMVPAAMARLNELTGMNFRPLAPPQPDENRPGGEERLPSR